MRKNFVISQHPPHMKIILMESLIINEMNFSICCSTKEVIACLWVRGRVKLLIEIAMGHNM